MRITCLIFLTFWVSTGLCQLNNLVFEDRLAVEEADSGKVFVGFNALGFFKNNEYAKTIVEGYTLFGYQLQPYISYHVTKNIRIDAGAYFQKDFGKTDLTTVAPIFSLKWKSRDVSVIFGNLEGSLNHRLIEPLYDFERVLTDRLETGVQFQLNQDDFFVDAWFDWQYMQHLNDSKQEQFVAGLSLQKRVLQLGSGSLFVPVQIVSRHLGGQLDATGLPIQTLVNTAAGINWVQPINGFAREVSLSGYYVFDEDVTKTGQAYLDGDGVYINGMISTRFGLEVMASYWQAREFMSFQGGRIYPSVSPFDSRIVQPSPHLMILRFLYNYQVADRLTLSLRYEPYYDLAYKSFQYSYGFYINYRARYFLANPRP